MKAAGLIYVTGPMGAGKSLYGTRRILRTIMAGRYVIANILLTAGWAERLTFHTPQGFCKWLLMKLGMPKAFEKQVRFYESIYIFETNLERATAFNPHGIGENRADVVWDELHKDMNNRTWFMDNQNYVNDWATHLRKMGFSAFFLTQHKDNTDAALRRIANFEVRLRNQRELVRLPLGIRLPFHFFIAYWVPANIKRLKGEDIIRTERYFRGWESRCYDTHAVHYDVDASDSLLGIGTIKLPKPGELTPEKLREIRAQWTLEHANRELDREESAASGASVAGNKNGSPKNGGAVRLRVAGKTIEVVTASPKTASPKTASARKSAARATRKREE